MGGLLCRDDTCDDAGGCLSLSPAACLRHVI